MAVYLTDQATDITTPGASPGGPSTVFASGTFDGATVSIQLASIDDPTKYGNPAGTNLGQLRSPGNVSVLAAGQYFLRVVLANSGPATSVSVETTP